jgi:hypothetical protein
MKKTKCKTCGGKVNSHNYCNACLTFAQPEAQTEHKCSHCNGKGYNTAFQDNVPADGWEARGLPQMAAENVKVPCPKCGGCGQYMIDVKCDCHPQPTDGLVDYMARLRKIEDGEPLVDFIRQLLVEQRLKTINECLNALPLPPFTYPETDAEYSANYYSLHHRAILQSLKPKPHA